jgi:hypothetical protein
MRLRALRAHSWCGGGGAGGGGRLGHAGYGGREDEGSRGVRRSPDRSARPRRSSWSGKGGPSPDLPPPRTVRATCAAHGSSLRHLVGGAEDPVLGAPYISLRHGPIGIGPLRRLTPVGLFGSHRLTSPIGSGVQTLRFRRDPPEVCALSGRVSPALAGPIPAITAGPSLAPALLYPLRRHPSSRSGFHLAVGRMGLTLLPEGELRPGRLRPLVRRELLSPSPVGSSSDPTRLPFWSRPPASWACRMLRTFDGRSLALSLPVSARADPDRGSQASAHCPRRSARRIAPPHRRVAAPR